jgi:predicted O-methyltransferase YrrM
VSTEADWERVDRYLEDRLLPADAALEAALAASRAAGLPEMQVSPTQGRLLELLARSVAARRVLEIGTLGGYSSIWLARALPSDGRLLSLELEPAHAAVARANVARAGLSERVEIRVGPALELLPGVAAEAGPPFDLFFIDADKANNPRYVEWALRLGRPGSMIVVDNLVRQGRIADVHDPDPRVQGARALLDLVRAEPRLRATAVQTVGAKGYDGFLLARIEAPS